MTVTLELSPETAERLEAAKAQGMDMNTLLDQALSNQLPPRRPTSGFGKFAYLKEKGGVEDFHKERQADRDRENRE